MSIGDRVKLGRSLAQMTQRELAQKVGVTHQAISKYERNMDLPSTDVLLRLSKALSVELDFFFRTSEIKLKAKYYRQSGKLTEKQKDAVNSQVRAWIERYFEIENLVMPDPFPIFAIPGNVDRHIASIEDAERVAGELRISWSLGLDPIDSLTELLESKGIKVGLVEGVTDFDACVYIANGIPVMAIKDNVPGDRQRFSLCHELAHIVLEPIRPLDMEKAANRFAGAFLVPKEAVIEELGHARTRIHLQELFLLKHKYGLSMQGWVHRAEDLSIISHSTAGKMFAYFKANKLDVCEPGKQISPEIPSRMERLALKGIAEGLISDRRATELLNKPLDNLSLSPCVQRSG